MLIDLKVKTLDAQTHEFNIDNEITVREFKDKIAEKTRIAAEQQRIIYCGRVLADEKQLKEYDVNGKVVHVAERPPPSARGNAPTSPVASDQPPRRTTRGMRNSPLFRALDGMVVGTMAIPMNASVNNGQMQLNPFTSSSSFCMNRITVARHMLECANNIAAFLEDPSRGLNNSSLDILAQGRWTMESTVVEVGITAGDIPQEQNIVDMLEGAVSAALRRNGNTNVTVVQLPTVFGSSENPDGTHTSSETTAVVVEEPMEDALDDSADSAALNTSTTTEEMETANDDDVVITEEATVMPSSPSVSSGAGATAGTSSSTASVGSSASGGASVSSSSSTTGNTVEQNASSRRRTGTNVLADVIDQMRAIQTRLNPFVEQFYDMLRNEPTFEENDTVGRDNAQRLYDRVSEAFHYMSHAQHAISDLLLDVSQPAPRFLACRPILVEQSGYVSSNNYLSAAAAAAAAGLGNLGGNGQGARQQPQQQQQQQNQTAQQQPTMAQAQDTAAAAATSTPPAATVDSAAATPAAATSAAETTTAVIDEPVDDPNVSPTVPAAIVEVNPANGNSSNNANHQMQVARLIQAVVNSAPIDTEFHVQINAPSIVSFGVPLNANAAAAAAAVNAAANSSETRSLNQQQEQQSGSNSATESQTNSNGNNSPTGTGTTSSPDGLHSESPNQTRSTTATLPTTATQTRSTSRPHVQMGNLVPSGGWNGRVIPANMMSSFDRFLPCNSHHVREPENANHANHANGGGTGGPTAQLIPNTARVNQRTLRTITDLFRHVRPPPLVGATTLIGTRPTTTAAPGGQTATPNSAASAAGGLSAARTTTTQPTTGAVAAAATAATGGTSSSSSSSSAATDMDTQRRIRLRVQLQNFISEHMFEGVPISDDTMAMAVNKTLRWIYDILIFLPQYDLPEYDSRDSIENLLRHTLPLIINLINSSQENPAQFEQQLTQLCGELFKRLFSILAVCAGRVNAEIYWCELMRTLVASLRTNFRGEALQFLQIYVNTKVPTATDTNDVQQFVVHRNIGEDTSGTDTDVEMVEPATTSQTNSYTLDADNGEAMQLDSVVAGSEPWHSNFPVSWLPVISHDIQKQKELESKQMPYSDAYISGMSAKRRKMIQSSKPGSDIKSLINDSVRNALQTAGVSNSSASNQSQSLDEITAAIANDSNVQVSYSEALRTNVRERLKNDTDYKPEKFPQTSKFLNK